MKKIKLFFTLTLFSIINASYYNNYSNPPIIVSTVCGDLSQVKSYCTASTINTIGNNGQTALMHSCISNSGDIFVFLMENNADFNIKDSFGKTALDYAIEHNRVEMIEYLAISGADTNGLDVDKILKDAQDAQEITHKKIRTQEFITEAGKYNPDLNKIKSYIAAGANLKAKDYDNNTKVLMVAAYYGHTEIVKLLIAAGVNVNAKDNYGETALMTVVKNGCTEMVKLLIAAGADVNDKNNCNWSLLYGCAALMMAAREGHTETAKLLIDAGADVDAKSNDGCTALTKVLRNGHTEIAKLLIADGADINARDNYGCTALIYAAINGYTEIANLLITAGADVNIKNNGTVNNDGKTALMLAKDYNHPEIVKLLEQHAKNKAKVNSTKKAKIISVKKALNKKKNHEKN